MNWNDLGLVWRRQNLPLAAGADLASLTRAFETSSRKLARKLFWRDLREVAAGLLLIWFCARTLWHGGKAYWPFALALLLMLGLMAFFLRERIRARRMRPEPNTPVLAKLEGDIVELRHQRRLLINVATWYLAPCGVSWAIGLATLVINDPDYRLGRHHPIRLVCYIIGGLLLGWGIWALNRRAARKKIEPRIVELEKLRNDLLSSK